MVGGDDVGSIQLTAVSTNQPQLKESSVTIEVHKPNYIAFSGANELYSYGGKNWVLKESTGFIINSVALSGGYVAVGQTGNGNNSAPHSPLLITSDDGINWNKVNDVISEDGSAKHLFNLSDVNGSMLTSGIDPSISPPLSNYFGGYYESNGVIYSFGRYLNHDDAIVLSQQYESANMKMCFTSTQKYASGSNVYYNNNIFSYFTNIESSCTGTLGESNLNSYTRRDITRSIVESIDTIPQLSSTYGIQNIATQQNGFITYGASNQFVRSSDGMRFAVYPTILLQDFPKISAASATSIYIGANSNYESSFIGDVVTAFSAVPTHSSTHLPYVGFISMTTGLKPYVFTISPDGSNQQIKALSINGDSSYFYAIQVVSNFLGDAFTVIGVDASGKIVILNSTDGLNWQPANVPTIYSSDHHATVAR